MENHSDFIREDEHMELPPGFRFHPTDEELITHYLSQKVLDNNFKAIAIGEVDFNKVEPWDLPRKARMGVKEWYFFCMKDRKYPTGLRTNRATQSGYWKATGKDKEIYRAKSLIGMKKTLVFYTGRAPRGEKTNWVMHEYRLDGKYLKLNLSKPSKNEWVLSRVFDKGLIEKKLNYPGFVNLEELHPRSLPPLMDSSSPNKCETKKPIIANSSQISCFSDHTLVVVDPNSTSTTATNTSGDHFGALSTTRTVTKPCSSSLIGSNFAVENSVMDHSVEDFPYIDSIFAQDQSILRLLIDGKDSKMNGSSSQETGLSVGDINYDVSNFEQMDQNLLGHGPIDLDCLLDY